MDILKNPFHILGATTRDNRHSIMELAEERSLLSDTDECMEARSILINPRRRISAEVAWLVGIDPALSDEVLKCLDAPTQSLLNIAGLTPIARANLLVSGLSRLPNLLSTNIVEWILAIAQASETINPEMVCAILNEDRRTSGFPEIIDLSAIDDEIRKQKSHYRQVLTTTLESLSVTERASILTMAIETSTGNSRYQCPILIEDLILSYELGVQDSLEQKQKIIEVQDEKLRAMIDAKNPDTTLQPIVNQLIQTVKEWDTLAQPIQLNKKSRGERHASSFEIAWRVQRLAVDLFNEYLKYDFSLQFLNMLLDVFAEVPEIVERITRDKKDLESRIHEVKGIEKFTKINTQVEKLKEAADTYKLLNENPSPDYTLTPMVNQLIQTVKTWNTTTQPVEANNAVAITVRNIALHLWNEHQKLDFAIQIINALIGVFKGMNGMHEVNNRLSQDITTLTNIHEQRRLQNQNRSEDSGLSGCLMDKIITYAVVFGIFGIIALIGSLMEGC